MTMQEINNQKKGTTTMEIKGVKMKEVSMKEWLDSAPSMTSSMRYYSTEDGERRLVIIGYNQQDKPPYEGGPEGKVVGAVTYEGGRKFWVPEGGAS